MKDDELQRAALKELLLYLRAKRRRREEREREDRFLSLLERRGYVVRDRRRRAR